MRHCRNSSIGSGKPVREVILSWARNRLKLELALRHRRPARHRRGLGRRQRPRRPLVGPVGERLSAGTVAAGQCADPAARRRHRRRARAAAAPAPSAARAISARRRRSRRATRPCRAIAAAAPGSARCAAPSSSRPRPRPRSGTSTPRRAAPCACPAAPTCPCGAPTAEAATLTITGPNGASQTVAWPAGAATVAWPSGGADHQRRRISAPPVGLAVPSRILVKTLQSRPADFQGVAEALIQNECREQLDLLVDTAPSF